MGHERSVTQGKKGKYVNVYGEGIHEPEKTGLPLPLRYDFEKESYETLPEAELAASKRSDYFSRDVQEAIRRHTDFGVIDQDYIFPK